MKKRIISMIAAFAIGVSLFTGMAPSIAKANDDEFSNDMKEKLQSMVVKDEQSKKRFTSESEVVEILVQLQGKVATEEESGKYDEKALFIEQCIKSSQQDIIKQVEDLTGNKVEKTFAYLVNGFSIQGKRSDIDKISKIKGVKSVAEAPKLKVEMISSKDLSKVNKVYQDYGYKGEGMVVSVIDTGVDYTHKDFKITDASKVKLTEDKVKNIISNKLNGRGKYFSDKVPFGYNYAEFDNNIKNEVSEHGQHVTGIIGANGSDEEENNLQAIKGVAPEAQILAMKIADSESGALTGDIILALEDSVKLGADVVNISFGSDGCVTSSEDMFYKAIENATDKGVLVVNAAGNAQTFNSNDVLENPTNGYNLKDTSIISEFSPSTLMVGSVNNDYVIGDGLLEISDASGKKVSYACTFNDDFNVQFDINNGDRLYYFGDDYSLIDETNFKNKIIVVDQKDSYYEDIIKKASEQKAKMIVEVSIFDGIKKYEETCDKVPVMKIGKMSGEQLIKKIKKNSKEKFIVNLNKNKVKESSSMGGQISNFSSWGPSPNLELRPDIVAPGGNIYSTINDNKYDTYNGTSMATPFTSGSEAIFYQSLKDRNINVNGRDKVMLAKQMFMNTAFPIINSKDKVIYSPRQQGAGLLQLDRAIKNMVTLTNSETQNASLSLKNIGNSKEFKLKLKNYSNEDICYETNEEKLYTEYTDKNKNIHEKEIIGARITFNSKQVIVPANSEVYLTGKLTIDDGALELNNFVEGYITLISTNEEICDLSMPVLAFYGDYSKESIIDIPSYYSDSLKLDYTAILDDETLETIGYELDSKGNYKINPENIAFSPNDDKNRDVITLTANFLRAAKSYNIQILDKDKNVLEMPYGNDYIARGMGYGRTFDGTIYDSTTGEKKCLKEGQYYARFIVQSFIEGSAKQILDIPFKIDLTAPKININSVYTTKSDEEGKEKYNIEYTAEDKSGIAINSLVAFNKNIDSAIEAQSTKIKNGYYVASFEVDKGSMNTNEITLAVKDNAGNSEVVTKDCKIIGKKAVTHNLEDNMTIDLIKKDFYFYGNVRMDVDKLYLNNELVEIKNNSFRKKINYKQGENTYVIKALDSDNHIVYSKKYTVYADTIEPKIVDISSDNKLVNIDMKNHIIKLDKSVNKYKIKVKYNKSISLNSITGIGFNLGIQDDISPTTSNNDNTIFTYEINSKIDCLYFAVRDFSDNMAKENPYYIYSDSVYSEFENTFSADKQSVLYGKQKNDQVNLKIKFVDNTLDLTKVKTFINAQECIEKIENNELIHKYKLRTGFDDADIVVNYEGKEIYHKKISIFYDNEAPTITLNNQLDIKPNGKIYVGKDKTLDSINLSGTVTDNNFDYQFFINNSFVLKTSLGGLKQVVSDEKDPLEREFSREVQLGEGDNYISLLGYDQVFNEEETILKIHNGPVILDKPIYEEVNDGYVIKMQDEEDLDYIEVSTDRQKYERYTPGTVLSKDKNIYARAISYTGQTSEELIIKNNSNEKEKNQEQNDNKENQNDSEQHDNKDSQLSNTGDKNYLIYVVTFVISFSIAIAIGMKKRKTEKR